MFFAIGGLSTSTQHLAINYLPAAVKLLDIKPFAIVPL